MASGPPRSLGELARIMLLLGGLVAFQLFGGIPGRFGRRGRRSGRLLGLAECAVVTDGSSLLFRGNMRIPLSIRQRYPFVRLPRGLPERLPYSQLGC